jgi:hypothetical protein
MCSWSGLVPRAGIASNWIPIGWTNLGGTPTGLGTSMNNGLDASIRSTMIPVSSRVSRRAASSGSSFGST